MPTKYRYLLVTKSRLYHPCVVSTSRGRLFWSTFFLSLLRLSLTFYTSRDALVFERSHMLQMFMKRHKVQNITKNESDRNALNIKHQLDFILVFPPNFCV